MLVVIFAREWVLRCKGIAKWGVIIFDWDDDILCNLIGMCSVDSEVDKLWLVCVCCCCLEGINFENKL
jgi:hypothetical protein